jgi:peptidoglycan lytic transglycosylase
MRGIATYYPGRAAGMRKGEFSAAHKTLPFGTRVRVKEIATGRSVVVKVNDRGPFAPGRIIDVSHGAARALGIISKGITEVELEVVR